MPLLLKALEVWGEDNRLEVSVTWCKNVREGPSHFSTVNGTRSAAPEVEVRVADDGGSRVGSDTLRRELEAKRLDELRGLVRRLGMVGYSSAPKAELVEQLLQVDEGAARHLKTTDPPTNCARGGLEPYRPALWEKILRPGMALAVVVLIGFLGVRNQPFRDPNLVVLIRIVLSTAVAMAASPPAGPGRWRGLLRGRRLAAPARPTPGPAPATIPSPGAVRRDFTVDYAVDGKTSPEPARGHLGRCKIEGHEIEQIGVLDVHCEGYEFRPDQQPEAAGASSISRGRRAGSSSMLSPRLTPSRTTPSNFPPRKSSAGRSRARVRRRRSSSRARMARTTGWTCCCTATSRRTRAATRASTRRSWYLLPRCPPRRAGVVEILRESPRGLLPCLCLGLRPEGPVPGAGPAVPVFEADASHPLWRRRLARRETSDRRVRGGGRRCPAVR